MQVSDSMAIRTRHNGQPHDFPVFTVLAALCTLLLPAFPAAAYDTVGVDVSPFRLNQPKITEMRWTASVAQFVNSPPNNLPDPGGFYPLRIEFNGVFLAGSLGRMSLGLMVQNRLHDYSEASCSVSLLPGGLELYFTVIDDFTRTPNPNLVAGIALAADPHSFPFFARTFQNIDGSGLVGNNIYSIAAIGDARTSHPVAIEWHLRRGDLVTNPLGQLKKNIACNWVSLSGDFRQWVIDVTVDGVNYPVATYYLPEVYASYLDQYSPFVLHQEHFGACNNRLDRNETDVSYYGIAVLKEGDPNWIPISAWQVNYSYDGVCGQVPSDLRHGIGTSVKNGRKVLISRAGHANDVDMKRCDTETSPGFFPCASPPVFDGIDSPALGREVTIGNVCVATTSTAATIRWDTSAPADGMVQYGTTLDYGSHSAFDSVLAGRHAASIAGLQSGIVFYRIESIDGNGHLATQDGQFSVPDPRTPPRRSRAVPFRCVN